MSVMVKHDGLKCPSCQADIPRSSGMDDSEAAPSTGDVSMCIYCGSLALYEVDGKRLRLRTPTMTETIELQADPDVQRALTAHAALFRGPAH